MEQFKEQLMKIRTDLSEWLVHFTRGTDEIARETLEMILAQKKLVSKNMTPPCICFSEAPLDAWSKMSQIFQGYRQPMFSRYGIAVRKEWLFSKGGRNTIYISNDPTEVLDLSKDEKHSYRLIEYTPGKYDFTWLREWRFPGRSLELDPQNVLVITPDLDASLGLTCDWVVEHEPAGPDEYDLTAWLKHEWRFCPLDQFKSDQPVVVSDTTIKIYSALKLDQ